MNLFEPNIPKFIIEPDPPLRLHDFKKRMGALVGVYVLYSELHTKNQKMFKITNVDDTEKVFWSYKFPAIRINMHGQDIRHPENFAQLITNEQREKIKYHWQVLKERNREIKFIREKLEIYPPNIVHIIFKLVEKYNSLSFENKNSLQKFINIKQL